MSDQDNSFFDSNEAGSDQNTDANNEATHNNSAQGETELGQVVSQLVGEGKKYKSVEDLAKSRVEADNFIEQLKREQAELREDLEAKNAALEKAKSVDDALDSLKREHQDSSQHQEGLDEETLAKLIDTRLDERTEAEKRSDNKRVVNEALIKRFGEQSKADAYIAAKAQEIGTPISEMKEISQKNPEMFFRILGIDPNSQGGSGVPAGQQHNSESVLARSGEAGPKHGTYEYYKAIRKSNPKAYYNPKLQNEMMESRKKLGEAFYNK